MSLPFASMGAGLRISPSCECLFKIIAARSALGKMDWRWGPQT